MSLAILTDDDVKRLLEFMTLDELEDFRTELKTALHEYSNGTQFADSEVHQPERTVITTPSTGSKTLFMPSTCSTGLGIKVVTLQKPAQADALSDDPSSGRTTLTGAITLFSETGNPIGLLHASTLTAFRTALASSCLLLRRNRVHTITVFGAGEQAYWHLRLALMMRGKTIRHIHIINRRFSGACKNLLQRFYHTPPEVKQREGWQDAEFGLMAPSFVEFDRLMREQVRAADVIFCCTPSTQPLFDHAILTNTEGRRKGRLIVAIGSYTPEMRELPTELLVQATKTHESGHRHYHKHAVEGGVIVVDTLDGALKESGEIIEAGLTPKQLVELGELVMLKRIKMEEESLSSDTSSGATNASDKSAPTSEMEKLEITSLSSGFTAPTSSMSSIFSHSAGDGTNSSSRTTSPSRTSSPVRKSVSSIFKHHRSGSHSSGSDRKSKQEDHMARWLQAGNVIYKSVGLGLMDLAVGSYLIKFAKEKGVGHHVEGF